jgi:hypothetical protein
MVSVGYTGVGADQVAIAWLLRHPSRMIPILGTHNATRLRLQAEAVSRLGYALCFGVTYFIASRQNKYKRTWALVAAHPRPPCIPTARDSALDPPLLRTKSRKVDPACDGQVNLTLSRAQWTRVMGASASANYQRWEQMHSGQWHDVAQDMKNVFGTPLGVDVPVGFCDFASCKMPGVAA